MAEALWDRLRLHVANRRSLTTDISDAVVDVSRDGTMEAAPTVAITIDDPQNRLMESQILVRPAARAVGDPQAWALRPIDIVVPANGLDVVHRLQQAQRQGDRVVLNFEHRGVAYMREHDWAISASRAHLTRALFVRRQVLEVGRRATAPHRLNFWAPDLRIAQPIARQTTADTLTSKAEDDRNVAGILDQADQLKGATVMGKRADAEQRRNLANILAIAQAEKAGPKATLAMVCAAISESGVKAIMNRGGSGYGGVFQGDVTARYRYFKVGDTEAMARYFLRGGKGFQGGGAIALAKAHKDWSPGRIALEVEGSLSNFGGDVAKGERFYNRYKHEAQRIILAGGQGGSAATGLASYTKPYRFIRKKGENGWDNTAAIAAEVQWRRFITGDTFIYAYDDALLQLPAQMALSTNHPAVVSWDFDLDYRKTVRSVSLELAATEGVDLVWGLPFALDDAGAATGKYLVWSVHEQDGADVVEVELRAAQTKKREPISETVQRADPNDAQLADEDNPKTSKAYDTAKAISERKLPYVWGGGHLRAGVPDNGTGRDPGIGYDCSGYTAAVLLGGDMLPDDLRNNVPDSGHFIRTWGEPGEGRRMTVWGNEQHIFVEFKIPDREGRYADTSRASARGKADGKSGPTLRFGKRSTAGFTPRHWPGDVEPAKRSPSKATPQFPNVKGHPENV